MAGRVGSGAHFLVATSLPPDAGQYVGLTVPIQQSPLDMCCHLKGSSHTSHTGPPRQRTAATQPGLHKKVGAVRTLESLARIELGAQGGALLERVTTTRISKSGVATTTVRERFTAPDWHADGWFGLVSADGAGPARPRSGEGG